MFEAVTKVLHDESQVDFALVFGSRARGTTHSGSDLDLAVGLTRPMAPLELGGLISRLEAAAGCDVDLVLLDEAGPGLSYRVFRDGIVVLDRNHEALVHWKARAVLEYFDWQPFEELFTRRQNVSARNGSAMQAESIASIRDAIARIGEVLPADASTFANDRTAREVVVLGLLVAINGCLSLAAHRLALSGRAMPSAYREVFAALAWHSVIPLDLAHRLEAAAGVRNQLALRHDALDLSRIHAFAAMQLGDLSSFCGAIEQAAA